MVDRYVLSQKTNDYLMGYISLLVGKYNSGTIKQRDTDVLRGMVSAFWCMDELTWRGYIFFINFACWLEGDKSQDDHENNWYQSFFNMIAEDDESA